MTKLKLIFFVLVVVILLVLAGEAGYYWATHQQTKTVPLWPQCPPSEAAPAATSPLIHPSVIDWLKGTTSQMTLYNDWYLGIDGEVQSLSENTLTIKKGDVSKTFTFTENQPIKYQKLIIETKQFIPIPKEEIGVGDWVLLDVGFKNETGETITLIINKAVHEEVPTTPIPPLPTE